MRKVDGFFSLARLTSYRRIKKMICENTKDEFRRTKPRSSSAIAICVMTTGKNELWNENIFYDGSDKAISARLLPPAIRRRNFVPFNWRFMVCTAAVDSNAP